MTKPPVPKPAPLAERRLKSLLANGYFPAELPPPFTTQLFADHAQSFAGSWKEEKIISDFWTKPEHYSVPRYGHARRSLSIVNPVNQLQVSKIISSNWPEIRKRLKRSRISEFDPKIILSGTGRAVTGIDFDAVARRRAHILGSYGRYVKSDIARFYPSIYTHSILWSVVGKEYAKQNYKNKNLKASFGNRLDKAVGSGQQGQTIGIPIGPDTSRIISELIATEIEAITRKHIPDLDDRSVRYVDDVLIGLNETETASTALTGLSSALYEYELELSAEKTSMQGMGCEHSPEWINYIRNFQLRKTGRQRDDIDSYFEQALHLSDKNPRDNVMLFAVKRAASFAPLKANKPHLIRWLLYSARRSPSCLRFVAEYLAGTKAHQVLPKDEIAKFISDQIPRKAEAAHTDEVAWLLFWAREMGLKLPASTFDKVRPLRSSVVGLVTLDLRQQGLIDGALKVPEWKSFATVGGLKSEMWLLAYEATKKGWWPGSTKSGFVSGHQFFGDLFAAGVEFYDPKQKAKNTVTPASKIFRLAAMSMGSGGYPA